MQHNSILQQGNTLLKKNQLMQSTTDHKVTRQERGQFFLSLVQSKTKSIQLFIVKLLRLTHSSCRAFKMAGMLVADGGLGLTSGDAAEK
jgi:hypothetical protein